MTVSMAVRTSSPPTTAPGMAAVLPIMTVVLVSFLVIGLALPVLPLHVHQGLGFGTFVVGLVAGSQFAASLLSRVWAGYYSDSSGAKHGIIVGLLAATALGLLYFLSLGFIGSPITSVTVLLLGRGLLGVAESFIITGAISWGLALVDSRSSGRVIAWVGMALFTALALRAPIGTALYTVGGFPAVALATTLVPLATLLVVAPLSPIPARRGTRPAFRNVAGVVWAPGLGTAFNSIGFGAIIAFSALMFAERGWSPVWLPFSAFAACLIAARGALGQLPDKFGGAKVALVCVVIEAVGLAMIWLASGPLAATTGAAITGLGYSLIYPGLGLEAVRRAPPESRGLALGMYTVFLDVALGFGTPILGLIAGWAGLGSVFFVSMLSVLCTAVVALRLLKLPSVG